LLINSHYADIGTGPERFFQSSNGIVGGKIRTARARIDVHKTEFGATNGSCKPRPAVYGDLLPGYRIDPNLAAKKQLVLIADIEVEYPGILQEELALLRNKDLERGQIKWFKIYFSIGEISVACQV